jgi:hypothetical protein
MTPPTSAPSRAAAARPLGRTARAWLGLVAPLGFVAAVAAAASGLSAARGQPSQAATAMDRPIAFLDQTRAALRRVADYECTLVSRERVHGKLLPEQVMTTRARRQPFSVYLHFDAPDSSRGQEVCFVEGRNKGMMRIHPAGWRGIVGFVSIDPNDPRVFEECRHPITEAGLWSAMDETARYWETERRLNKTEVRIDACQFQQRPCTRIETTHPIPGAGPVYAYRCVLCVDDETHLPVRIEAYDRPRPSGAPGGDLLECYSYLNLRSNLGIQDAAFNR